MSSSDDKSPLFPITQSPTASEIYHRDKIVAILKIREPGKEPTGPGKAHRVPGPLFDLVALQEKLKLGEVDLNRDDHCWVGTDNCYEDLKKLQWTTGNQVQKLILCLKHGGRGKGDYVNSQWCEDGDGRWNACDSYKARIDEKTWKRDLNAPLYYLKFSIEESGQIYLVLISCHLDKPF